MSDDIPSLAEAMTEIRRLRARIIVLEAEMTTAFGTLEKPAEDAPATITHDIPPNAPR